MNILERKMVDLLVEMKEKYSVTSVKAEFEAEGTRIEEAMRLKEISMRAGLEMTIKVGGCEALKDMFEAASLGAKFLVGPMVESPFALRKYLSAIKVAFSKDQREDMEFYINIETITSYNQFDEILNLPEIGELDGVVIGRHDMSESMGMPLDEINGSKMLDMSLSIASRAKSKGLKVIVGGAVSVKSKPFFNSFPAGQLDKFETRKIVFSCPGALHNPDDAYLRAVEFEINWLKNKNIYYSAINFEGEQRLKIMEDRYRKSIESIK